VQKKKTIKNGVSIKDNTMNIKNLK